MNFDQYSSDEDDFEFQEPDIAEMYLLDSWHQNDRHVGVFLLRWASRDTYEIEILNPDAWAGKFSVPDEKMLDIAEKEAACVYFALANAPLIKMKNMSQEDADKKAAKRNWKEFAAFHGQSMDEVASFMAGGFGTN